MDDSTTLERPARKKMPAAMPKASTAPRARRECSQPSYHTEISDDYLDEMQHRVDAEKPVGFKLKAISEPGW